MFEDIFFTSQAVFGLSCVGFFTCLYLALKKGSKFSFSRLSLVRVFVDTGSSYVFLMLLIGANTLGYSYADLFMLGENHLGPYIELAFVAAFIEALLGLLAVFGLHIHKPENTASGAKIK